MVASGNMVAANRPLMKGCINGNIHPLCTVYDAYFIRQCSGFLHKDNDSPSQRLEGRQVKECLKSEQTVKYSLAFAHLLGEGKFRTAAPVICYIHVVANPTSDVAKSLYSKV